MLYFSKRNPDSYDLIVSALLEMYGRQGVDEQMASTTRWQNDIGFNAFDAGSMSPLARKVQSGYKLTPFELDKVAKTLSKYRGQLESVGIILPKYSPPAEITVSKLITKNKDGFLELSFPYTQALVAELRACRFAKKYNPESRTWISVDKTRAGNEELVRFAEKQGFEFTPEARQVVNDLIKANEVAVVKPTRIVDYNQGVFAITFPYESKLVDAVKEIPSRKYDSGNRVWSISRTDDDAFAALSKFIGLYKFTLTDRADKKFSELKKEVSGQKTTKAELAIMSKAEVPSTHIAGLERLTGKLRPYQQAGVEYALKVKRTILGDEPGLGKTMQALGTVEVSMAYPCLVICPNHLKYNWKREIEKWLPQRKVTFIESKSTNFSGDIVIVNYDILKKHINSLKAINFESIVVDESQYIKNYKAIRTKLVTELAQGKKIRLFLTGTAVKNRPLELVSQLQALDRLDQFGGFWNFVKRYCAAEQTRYGWDLSGNSNTGELNEKLREICYIQRNKKDVLKELPDKQRIKVVMDIDNMPEYKKAERDLREFLKNKPITDKKFLEQVKQLKDTGQLNKSQEIRMIEEHASQRADRAMNAEQLAKIEYTKQLAVKGKMSAFKEWVENFLESGEKLIVYVNHTDVADQLGSYFTAPIIYGGTSIKRRDEIVTSFDDPKSDTNLLICNIKSGGTGLNLQHACSNVAFLEQEWSPSDHIQAEDRVHRFEQKNAVTAYYFLGKDTVDEDINNLIIEKMEVVDSVNKGSPITAVDEETRKREQQGVMARLSDIMQARKNPLSKKRNPKSKDNLGKFIFVVGATVVIIMMVRTIMDKNQNA